MATNVLSNDDLHTNIDDKHLEIFCLIWLDANPNETRQTEQKLRSIINHLKKFQDARQCQQYITERSQKDRLILIVNGHLGQQIVPSIHHLRQVISIYVYCMDKKRNEEWACKYRKIKAIITDLDKLICQIETDHKIQKKVEEPLSINIFTTSISVDKSTIGVNGEFVFSQVLIDCLLRLKSAQIDFDELRDCCIKQYEGNSSELNNIYKFAQEYSPENVLHLYTRESFFYKTLNAALRRSDIHMIFLFRSFISDIYQQLKYNQTKNRLRVYRSQLMSSDELNALKQSTGQFISVNSFFSTSNQYEIARFYLGDTTQSIDLERVLFQIDADPKVVSTKPFADISKNSHFNDEAEVLFMLGSIFRLESIVRNDDTVWIIRMSLCGDDEHDLRQVLTYMKQQTGNGETNLRILGKVLQKMGKVDLAGKYFNRLLKELPINHPLISSLYEDLGELASQTGNYDMSVKWHQKALEFKNTYPSTVNSNINQPNTSIQTQFVSRITNKTQWKQHGITIARGFVGVEQFNHPYALSIDNDQQSIYIVDHYNHRIVEWKLNTNNSQVIAGGNGQGNQINQLNGPTDVVIDIKNNSLIICDRGNRRVVEWSRQTGTKNGQNLISDIDCYGITMNKNGYIYVSDTKTNEVRRWKRGETDGIRVAGRNGQGNRLKQLNFPTYIFVDQNNSIYISDNENHRVMKWTKSADEGIIVAGEYRWGDQLTQLHCPNGVIVDHLGNVYVADSWNHRIMCWLKGSKEGRIIVGGNGEGQNSNQLNSPRGLLFDQQNNLYVIDRGNDRVQKFEIDRYE